MKKMIFWMLSLIVLSTVSVNVVAQVRIGGNTNPVSAAVLDLNADSTTNANTKGLALPRVALTSTSSAAPLTRNVAGMLVYNTATAGDVTPGTYYNTGLAWVRIGGGNGTLTGVTAGTGVAVTANGTTPTVGIKAGGVTNSEIAAGTITNDRLAGNTIDSTKIKVKGIGYSSLSTSGAIQRQALVFDGNSWIPSAVTTFASFTVDTIVAGAATNGMEILVELSSRVPTGYNYNLCFVSHSYQYANYSHAQIWGSALRATLTADLGTGRRFTWGVVCLRN